MSKEEKKRIEQRGSNLAEIIESLEKGESILDDYPEEVIAKLRRLFDREKKK
jgi:exonuclease VII small subunit